MYENLEQEAARVRRALEGVLAEITEARREMEQAQARLEGLFPLKVVWKGKTCGKRSCRCTRGVLHGPYAYLVEHREGKKLERYLGKGFTPPEGMVSPERYRTLMRELTERRGRLEELMGRLDRAVAVLRGW